VLRLPEDWVWDSWIADDGERYHLFFLKAPRALGDPELRHTASRIGHATSSDLTHWDVHADALAPAAGGWDDLALWTGSVARGDDGVWRLYYSALSTSRGLGVDDQRIGMAESGDLFTWRRVGGGAPLVVPDPRWYATLATAPGASATWRDPFVFKDPAGDGWHMLITARARGAPRLRDGVLGHARSADMIEWELGPPLSRPGGFGELEVSQVRIVDGRPLLVFTCHPDQQSPEQLSAFGGRFCTWSVAGDSLTGPWELDRARPFAGEPLLTAAPLVQRRDGSWALLGFRNLEPDAPARLEVVDPIPVALRDGELIELS
jgi:beta-fructofuranosidase